MESLLVMKNKTNPKKYGAYITQGKTPLHFDPRIDKVKSLRKP